MTIIATRVEDSLDIAVHDKDGVIKVEINNTFVNATYTRTEDWDLLTFEQKEALLDYYVSIYRSY